MTTEADQKTIAHLQGMLAEKNEQIAGLTVENGQLRGRESEPGWVTSIRMAMSWGTLGKDK